MPEDMTYDDMLFPDGTPREFLQILLDNGGAFTNSFRMPGTRPLQGWQVVNMTFNKPANKNAVYVALKAAAAIYNWTIEKIPPDATNQELAAIVAAAGPKTVFWTKWHYPNLVKQFREDGTPVMVGEEQKEVAPVYDRTPDWFLKFMADVVVGGTPEAPIMGRPTEIPQLNKWVHQLPFADMPAEVDEIVDNSTPDE